MKSPLTISIEEEQLKAIRHFCEISGLPISKLFEDHAKALYNTIRVTGLDKKKSYTKIDMVKMLVRGSFEPIS